MNWIADILFAHEQNRKPHFKIYKGTTKGTPIFESDSEADFDTNHQRLARMLERLRVPGQYVVQFKDKKDGNTGINDFPFEIPYGVGYNQQQQPGIGSMHPAQMGMSKEDVQEEIRKERQKWENEQALKEMKTRLEKMETDLKKAQKEASPFGEAIEMFKPHMPTIMGLLNRRAGLPEVGIAGLGSGAVPTQEEQQQQVQLSPEEIQECRAKLNEAIEFFVEHEGGYKEAVELIHKLYLKAKADPSQIALLKQLL